MSPKPRATRTITLAKETRVERHLAIYNAEPYPEDARRPLIRAECAPGPSRNGRRPCGWMGCRHHLALDVNVNDDLAKPPSLAVRREELEDLPETCSLDVVDRARGKSVPPKNDAEPHEKNRALFQVGGEEISLGVGCTLAEVAALIGVTRERARQLEMKALRKLRAVIDPELGEDRRKGARPSTEGVALGDGNYRMVRDEEDVEDRRDGHDDRRLAWDLSGPDFGESTNELALARAYAAYEGAIPTTDEPAPADEEL